VPSHSLNPAANILHCGEWFAVHDDLTQLIHNKLVNRDDRYVLTTLRSRYATKIDEPTDFREWYKSHGVSTYDTSADNTCKWMAFDVDDHSGEGTDTLGTALAIVSCLRKYGYLPLLEKSSANSYHVWVAFNNPIPSSLAYRLIEHIYNVVPWEVEPEIRPTKFEESTPYGTSLRLPGIHGGRRTYSGFTDDDGDSWHYTPELFLDWLRQPGDDPHKLTPNAIGSISFAEQEAERLEKERAEKQKEAEFREAFYKDCGLTDPRQRFDEAKAEFNQRMSWQDILAGHLVSIGADAWARNVGDDQNASTKSGFLVPFGKTAMDELNLRPLTGRKGLSKWEVHERFKNPSNDFGRARELLTDLGFLKPEPEPIPDPKPSEKPRLLPMNKGEVRVDGGSKIKPRARIINGISREDYVAEQTERIVERWNGSNRAPMVLENITANPAVIAEVIRDDRIRSLIVVDSIEAAHHLCESLTLLAIDPDNVADQNEPRVAVWDLARLRSDASNGRNDDEVVPWPVQTDKRGLRLNCKNKKAVDVKGLGFAVSSSLCGHCPWNRNKSPACELKQHNEVALLADHLIVTKSTLAFADLDTFGDRNLVLCDEVEPQAVMQMTTTIESVSQVSGIMRRALDYLENDDGFMSGRKFGEKFEGARTGESEKREKWISEFRSFLKSLPFAEKGYPLVGSIRAHSKPAGVEAFVFDAVQQQFRSSEGEDVNAGEIKLADTQPPQLSIGPLMQCSMWGNVGHYQSETDSISVQRKNKIEQVPIVTLAREVPAVHEFDNVEFDVVETDVDIYGQQRVIQHFCRVSEDSADRTVQQAVLAAIEEYKPSQATVVCRADKLDCVRRLNDPRIADVLTFNAARCGAYGKGQFVIYAGCVPIDDSELVSKSGNQRLFGDFRVREYEVENEAGGMQMLPLFSHGHPAELAGFQKLVRAKMGSALDGFEGPTTVVLTDAFTGFPLAQNSLQTVDRARRVISSLIPARGEPMTARAIVTQSGLSRPAVHRELKKDCYLKLKTQQNTCSIDSSRGFPLIGSSLSHRPYSKKESTYYTGDETKVSRFVWMTSREVAESLDCSLATAKRKIPELTETQKLVSNGESGRRRRYRWNDDFGGVQPTSFVDQHGALHDVFPPDDWDGRATLYVLQDQPLLAAVEDGDWLTRWMQGDPQASCAGPERAAGGVAG